ncbi:OmpA family protein [Tamlana fucoidanivorans]|uniref:Cell envelope biogenesis protein OmpA n=1 Tax=Allotamlana fucoidanivorans TaxID=2583814 RepID=A0A5C4SJT4_9FLAO|nr:OmpA family protein [Tamlana fucoidanivorans]TNJ44177.1 cell envelope biogenesis protein OmpA [Tamlana fucoidanivorans]
MIKKSVFALLTVLVLASCVSPKIYKDLEAKYADLKNENRKLTEAYEELMSSKAAAEHDYKRTKKAYDEAVAQRDKLQADYNATSANLENLKSSYSALEKNSSAAISANSQKNRELLAELEAKEQALSAEITRLAVLKKELEDRSNRVAELESLIAAKDAAMKSLKDAISSALTDFEGKGLTVEQRDGKVYVSMENKLLFNSGSWAVGSEGRRAVEQLGSVLALNPDIAVLIEGHTDNVPYSGNGPLTSNWDLSTKRATSIVNILNENSSINPENLTAAGRGEFAPIATNSSPIGRAKNRRIEVILTPKLDELSKLLNEQ